LNLAAYELDKALNLYLVPTVVERNVNGKPPGIGQTHCSSKLAEFRDVFGKSTGRPNSDYGMRVVLSAADSNKERIFAILNNWRTF
jgi:hypothetical protein